MLFNLSQLGFLIDATSSKDVKDKIINTIGLQQAKVVEKQVGTSTTAQAIPLDRRVFICTSCNKGYPYRVCRL
jgi:hypothetical protein